MLSSAFDLLQLIVEPLLFLLLLIGLQLIQTLILLESGQVVSKFIDEGRSPVFDEVVDDDQHVEVLVCLIEVVLEDPDALDGQVEDLLEGIDVVGEGSQFC